MRAVLVTQEARTEVISLDAPAVDFIGLRLLGVDGAVLFTNEAINLAAVLARSG
jgi:hypothetical protein